MELWCMLVVDDTFHFHHDLLYALNSLWIGLLFRLLHSVMSWIFTLGWGTRLRGKGWGKRGWQARKNAFLVAHVRRSSTLCGVDTFHLRRHLGQLQLFSSGTKDLAAQAMFLWSRSYCALVLQYVVVCWTNFCPMFSGPLGAFLLQKLFSGQLYRLLNLLCSGVHTGHTKRVEFWGL